ncbi:MAG: TetR/AcrR family transcriptional regulator [Chitinophagaceae bacterium]
MQANETEIAIIAAARRVFEHHGYTGARMQQIADEAGMSKASVHYYFRSKENLFDRIFDDTMNDFMSLVSTWYNDDAPWEEKLRHFVVQYISFLQRESLLFILREINRNPDLLKRHKKGKIKARFISYFESLREQGQLKGMDPKIIYIYMHALCAYPVLNQNMFRLTMGENEHDFQQLMRHYPNYVADTLIHLLKKDPTHT